ncbi:MAG: hypothetical protein COY40_00480 [Alphaproteobacteria bacterium CG_4_10_14_0_8_um_filter_53_9]|nr:MAG: hypothetical protein COY40_00480 [Alphaproteobacteria bacterium CG_4_10_14_0_8_um_filter_53_9]
MDNTQLTEWLQKAGKGDAAAFRKLANALGPRMHALATRLLAGNHASAEDVTQEVLIKLWQQAPNWQAGGSVAAYASRLTYTTSMDVHRRSKPTTSLDDDAMPELPVPESTTGKIYQHQQTDLILQAMKHLPERQQQAVSLTYFHEFQTRDVARAMETTEKGVEGLLARARKTMAAHLPQILKSDLN